MSAERKSLTARELIAALEKIEPETVVTWSEWDSERDITHVYGVAGVCANGELCYGGILNSYDGMPEVNP